MQAEARLGSAPLGRTSDGPRCVGDIHGFDETAVLSVGWTLRADRGDFGRFLGDDALGRNPENQAGADVHMLV